jgi:hypothetical protein
MAQRGTSHTLIRLRALRLLVPTRFCGPIAGCLARWSGTSLGDVLNTWSGWAGAAACADMTSADATMSCPQEGLTALPASCTPLDSLRPEHQGESLGCHSMVSHKAVTANIKRLVLQLTLLPIALGPRDFRTFSARVTCVSVFAHLGGDLN